MISFEDASHKVGVILVVSCRRVNARLAGRKEKIPTNVTAARIGVGAPAFLFGGNHVRIIYENRSKRKVFMSATSHLPPRQQLVAPDKWPIVGERTADPHRCTEPWRLTISGMVASTRSWSLEDLHALPQVERAIDIHCVTRWSKLGITCGGVLLRTLLDACPLLPHAHFLSFVARSARSHSTSLPLVEALQLETLVVLTVAGRPLPDEHGGPIRTITPGRYFYKSVKWLEHIRVLETDELGYWEREAGYHNEADPWQEQRYIVAQGDPSTTRRLLQRKDFSGRRLLGLHAAGRNLVGLNARGATLRNANFADACLRHACFEGANLSNAYFAGADLRNASFRSTPGQITDVEGADFREADLRGADLTGVALCGVSFCPDEDEPGRRAALIDRTTRIAPEDLEVLTPRQRAFVLAAREGINNR